jgi:hypothetical protein
MLSMRIVTSPIRYLYPSALFTASKPLAATRLSSVRIVRSTIVTSGSTCLYAAQHSTHGSRHLPLLLLLLLPLLPPPLHTLA